MGEFADESIERMQDDYPDEFLYQRHRKPLSDEVVCIYFASYEFASQLAIKFKLESDDGELISVWIPKSQIYKWQDIPQKASDTSHAKVYKSFWEIKLSDLEEQYGNINRYTLGRRPCESKPTPKPSGDGIMKSKHFVHLVQTGYTTVVVSFLNNQDGYTYKANMPLKEGDTVVVPTRSDFSFKVGEVVKVHDQPKMDLDSEIDYRWVTAKVDLGPYTAVLQQERDLVERLKTCEFEQRRRALLATMGIGLGDLGLLTDMGAPNDTQAQTSPDKASD